MFRHELYKTLCNRVSVIFIVIILIINVVQLIFSERNSYYYPVSAYKEMWDELEEEAGDSVADWYEILEQLQQEYKNLRETAYGNYETVYARYTGQVAFEIKLYERVIDEIESTLGYTDYLNEIGKTEEKIEAMGSFFNKDDFVYRNLVKTVKSYKNLTAFEAVPAASAGVIMATGSDVTDFLAIILILFFGIMVWLKEKEDGMLVIIRTSKNGRMRLGFTKFAVLVTSVVLAGTFLYLSDIMAAAFTYGLGDVTRSIVTVSEYIGALWRVSVIGFLGLNLLVKLAVYVWIAALVSVLCTAISGSIAAVGGAIFVSLINYALYEKVPALSKFMAFKYLNPYAVIKTELIFKGYKGLYFFGYSFDYRKCLLIILGIGIAACVYLLLRLFVKSPLRENGRKHFIAVKAFDQYIRMRRRTEMNVSIARHEFHRIFICSWILLFIVLVFIFQVSNGKMYNAGYASVKDYFVRMYLEKLSGPVTEEKKLYLENEAERLNDSTDTLEKEQEKAVKEVMTRLLYLDENTGTYILYDEPVGILTAADGNREDIVNALFFIVLQAFMMPFFFAPEWSTGMIKIISVTQHGRHKLT